MNLMVFVLYHKYYYFLYKLVKLKSIWFIKIRELHSSVDGGITIYLIHVPITRPHALHCSPGRRTMLSDHITSHLCSWATTHDFIHTMNVLSLPYFAGNIVDGRGVKMWYSAMGVKL